MNLSRPASELLGPATASILGRLAMVSTGLTGRRISALSGVSASTTQRVLTGLERIGLVDSTDAGQSRLHILNRSHVLWNPLENLLTAPARVKQIVGEAAQMIAGDGTTVALYGSVARHEAGPESDIDLLVVWGDQVDASSRSHLITEVTERVRRATGNRVEIVDVSREQLSIMVAAADPLVSSWRTDAETLSGPDVRRLIDGTAA